MPNPRNFFKNLDKKINFVFFINSEKTHHFKINYLLFRFLSVIFVMITIFIGVISIVAVNTLEEKKSLSQYVLNLKNFYIQSYFETRFNTHAQDEISEDIANSRKKVALKEVPTTLAPKIPPITGLVMQKIPEKKGTQAEISPSNAEINLNGHGIVVDKGAVFVESEKLILSFSLLNSRKDKGKQIAGVVCAQIEGVNSLGDKKTLNYPDSLKINSLGNPTANSCLGGEHVKFSRLRPATFEFALHAEVFKANKALVYFLEKNSHEPTLIKELVLN